MAYLTPPELNKIVTLSHLAYYSRGELVHLSQGGVFLQGQAVDGTVYGTDDLDKLQGEFAALTCAKWDHPRLIRHTKKAHLLILRPTWLLEFNESEPVEDILHESLQQNYRYSVQSHEQAQPIHTDDL